MIIKNTVTKEATEVSSCIILCYATTFGNTTVRNWWSTCVSCTHKILLDQA